MVGQARVGARVQKPPAHALDVGGPDGLGPRSPVSKAVQVPHAEQSKGLQC